MNQDIKEEWRDIQGYEGLYMVSDKGRVKSLKTGAILKCGHNGQGYKTASLCKNGKQKNYTCHRLVANAFIENPNNLPQVNHIDECKDNNDVSNLQWCDAKYNNSYSSHKRSYKINQMTLDGQIVKQWESLQDLENNWLFMISHIRKCLNGKRKTALGYKWCYDNPKKLRKFNRPIIVTTTEDGYIAEFRNLPEASRCLGIPKISIWFVLNGVLKTSHGFKFRYADEQ